MLHAGILGARPPFSQKGKKGSGKKGGKRKGEKGVRAETLGKKGSEPKLCISRIISTLTLSLHYSRTSTSGVPTDPDGGFNPR
jgi:hypothetical protein